MIATSKHNSLDPAATIWTRRSAKQSLHPLTDSVWSRARISDRRPVNCTIQTLPSKSKDHADRTGAKDQLIGLRYYYYALKTREEQAALTSPKLNVRRLLGKKDGSDAHDAGDSNGTHSPSKDHTEVNFANRESRAEISDREWTDASRAFRTASAGAAFYLVCVFPYLSCDLLWRRYLDSSATGECSMEREDWFGSMGIKANIGADLAFFRSQQIFLART